MAKKAKQKISETREDISEEIQDLKKEDIPLERRKRIVSEARRAVIKLKEIEARNKRGEKYQIKLKGFKELNVLNNRNIKTDAYEQKADEEKDAISMEMAWAQVDGKVSIVFEDMANLVRPERREEFFSKLLYDTSLKRDLVGMTEVIKHAKNRQFDKALYAMAYFNIKDRMFEMEQFFNINFDKEFQQKVEKFFSMAEANNLSESQIKDIAGKNMNFATGTMNEIKSSFASAITGEEISALGFAVVDSYSGVSVSLEGKGINFSEVSSFSEYRKQTGQSSGAPSLAQAVRGVLKKGTLISKSVISQASDTVLTGVLDALEIFNDESKGISKRYTERYDAITAGLKYAKNNVPQDKYMDILRKSTKEYESSRETAIKEIANFKYTYAEKTVGERYASTESLQDHAAVKDWLDSRESAQLALDSNIEILDKKIKELKQKRDNSNDAEEIKILDAQILDLEREKSKLSRGKSASIVGVKTGDFVCTESLKKKKKKLKQLGEEKTRLEYEKHRIENSGSEEEKKKLPEIMSKIAELSSKIEEANKEFNEEYIAEMDKFYSEGSESRIRVGQKLQIEVNGEIREESDIQQVRREKHAIKNLRKLSIEKLSKLEKDPEKNKEEIEEIKAKIAEYDKLIEKYEDFQNQNGQAQREFVHDKSKQLERIESILGRMETELDKETLATDFFNLEREINLHIKDTEKELKVDVINKLIGRLDVFKNKMDELEKTLPGNDKKRLVARYLISCTDGLTKKLQERIIELQTGKSAKYHVFEKKKKPPEEEKRDHMRTIQDNNLYETIERDDGTTRMKEVSKDEAGKRINRISNAINGILKHRNILTIEDIEYCEKNVDMCVQYLEECKTNTETQFKGITKLRETVKQMQEKVAKAKESLEREKAEERASGSAQNGVTEAGRQKEAQQTETNQPQGTNQQAESETVQETPAEQTTVSQESEASLEPESESNNQSEKVGGYTLAGEADPDATILEAEASPLPEPEGQTAALENNLTKEELAAIAAQKK